MELILLERVQRLGQMGDEVSVRNGYARNFLIPQGKALRATADNRKYFENTRIELEARNVEARSEALALAEKIRGETVVAIRQAGESGQLYGSVSKRDVADLLQEKGITIAPSQVELTQAVKTIGLQGVAIRLHAEVETEIVLNAARSIEEAERQSAGEDLTRIGDDEPSGWEVETASDDEAAPAEEQGDVGNIHVSGNG